MGTEALRIIAADGTSIAVDSSGDAGAAGWPPIVATHGWANDRSVWTPLVGELVGEPTGGHQVVTWDLRGHGDSDAPSPGAYSRKHVLADLAAVRVALDQELSEFDAPLSGVREVAFFPPMTGG